ncbi:MAG: aminoglycoside phosphotransferase family protein [Chloroflexi bacterium]|nr:aminoglycoside phosphotransferase family protein [Chloroflexota bacterium]
MLERPKLADELIIGQLRASYDLNVRSLEFLPIGNDARAWSFRVKAASGDYFLKLRLGPVNRASLLVPRYLQNGGLENVAAPMCQESGQLHAWMIGNEDTADYALMLYPYIEGESDWNMSLTAAQWRDWGRIMRSIHDAAVSRELADEVPHEVFALKWLDKIELVEAILTNGNYEGAVAETVARIWRDNADVIDLCRRRYLELGARMAEQSAEFVICHADIHPANIIIDHTGALHIVDWDEALLAPKERDLMFFIDDGRSADTTDAFLAGYGDHAVNLQALAYYKYDWLIQELGDYGERVFLADDLTRDDLALAQREFARLFAPDDVIDRAHRAYVNLLSSETETDAETG